MTDLAQLIADLESAQVGSLHYDKRILAALGFTWRGMAYWNSQEQWKGSAALTQSIDAIVALIERKLPGWSWGVSGALSPTCTGLLYEPTPTATGYRTKRRSDGKTPALALCVAFLRTIQSQQGFDNAPR